MQKTKDIVHNPISEEALELIGYSPDKRGKVFPDFKDSMTQAPLKNWLKNAWTVVRVDVRTNSLLDINEHISIRSCLY